jgi:hypothetical protein
VLLEDGYGPSFPSVVGRVSTITKREYPGNILKSRSSNMCRTKSTYF